MKITLRTATRDDLEQIIAAEAACFPPAEAGDRAAFQSRLAAFSQHFYLAEQNGILIGYIDGSVTDQRTISDEMFEDASTHKEDGAYQSVFGLGVLPEYRKRGIAAQLMRHFLEQAKKEGRKGVILTCKEHLIPYYEGFGYQNLGVSQSVHGGAVWYDMLLQWDSFR